MTAQVIRGPWTAEQIALNQFTAQINKDIRDFHLTGSFTAADVERIAQRGQDHFADPDDYKGFLMPIKDADGDQDFQLVKSLDDLVLKP